MTQKLIPYLATCNLAVSSTYLYYTYISINNYVYFLIKSLNKEKTEVFYHQLPLQKQIKPMSESGTFLSKVFLQNTL